MDKLQRSISYEISAHDPYVNSRLSYVYLTVHRRDVYEHPRKGNVSSDTNDIVTSSSLIVQCPGVTSSNSSFSKRCENKPLNSRAKFGCLIQTHFYETRANLAIWYKFIFIKYECEQINGDYL